MSPPRGSMVKVACERCGGEFAARTADRERGWARFCSKSCKARMPPDEDRRRWFDAGRGGKSSMALQMLASNPEGETNMAGPHPDPLDPIQNLEPAAVAAHPHQLQAMVEASKAISLKRIADLLTGAGLGHPEAWFNIERRVENIAYEAGRAFERGVEHGRRT